MHKKPDTQTAWGLIALVWLAGLGAAAQFGKIAVALSEFRNVYGVSDVFLGLLISCVGSVGLIFGVLGGALLVRLGTRACFTWGLAAAALFSFAQASLPPLGWMIALRILEGTSHLAIVIAGPILMARHSTPKTRPGVMTLWSCFFGVSYMVTALISGPFIAAFGLSGFLAGHGGYMAVLAVLAKLTLPAPEASQAGTVTPVAIPVTPRAFFRLHWEIYSSAYLGAAALGFVCYTVLYISLLSFLPDFAPAELRGGLSASMPFFTIVTSLTLGVFILARLPSVRAVQLGFSVQALAAIGLGMTLNTDMFIPAAIILMASSGLIPGASFAALADLNPSDRDRAMATGALAQMGNVGTTCGPPILAAIIGLSGFLGLVLFVLFFSGLGVSIHVLLARKRAAQAGLE